MFSVKDSFGPTALPRLQALVKQFDPAADAVTSLHWYYNDPKASCRPMLHRLVGSYLHPKPGSTHNGPLAEGTLAEGT